MSADFGVYVHSPWCARRCPYCAFYVVVDPAADHAAWAAGVQRDWAEEAPVFEGEAHSLYFGGGTPSLVDPSLLGGIAAALPLAPGAEVTCEINPGTVSAARLAALRGAGVNRASVGIQTFQPRHARTLSRGHTVGEAEALLALIRQAGFRSWSFDLIFALPGQSVAELDADLDALLRADPPHVSLYGLTFEPGTPLARARAAGRVEAVGEDLWAEMMARIVERLVSAGYERYEVSNFARPGHRAVHNGAVWRGGTYAGLGPSAHGFRPDGTRTVRPADLAAWSAGAAAAVERPGADEAAADFVLSTLRHVEGTLRGPLRAAFHREVDLVPLAPLLHGGMLRATPDALQLGPAGWDLADGVIRAVLGALRPTGP
jgi:oxygen-independent coproporphyrinogen-3 oxidase